VVAVAAAAGIEVRSAKTPRVQIPARRVAVAVILVVLLEVSVMILSLCSSV